MNFILGNALTDNAIITAFDVDDQVLIVSFQSNLKNSNPENEVYIMSYDLQEKKALWTKRKSQDRNIIESVKIMPFGNKIIAFDQNKTLLYIDMKSGSYEAEFKIVYAPNNKFVMIYDKFGTAYLASNGTGQSKPFIHILSFDMQPPLVSFQQLINTGGDVGNNIQSICISDDDKYVYSSISANYQGLMAQQISSTDGLIGLTVLDLVTAKLTLYYQVSFKYTALQDYPYSYADYNSVSIKSNNKIYMSGLIYQESGFNPQGFINEYLIDPTCNYQQPYGPIQTFSITELDLFVRIESNNYYTLQLSNTKNTTAIQQFVQLEKAEYINVYNNNKPCQFQYKNSGGFSSFLETPTSIQEPVFCFTDLNCGIFLGVYKLMMPCSNLNTTLIMNLFNSQKNGLWFHDKKYSKKSLSTLVNITFNGTSQHQQQDGIMQKYQNIVQLGSQEDLILSSSLEVTIHVYWKCEIAIINSTAPQIIYLSRNKGFTDAEMNLFQFIYNNDCFNFDIVKAFEDDKQFGELEQSYYSQWAMINNIQKNILTINTSEKLTRTKYIFKIRALNQNNTLVISEGVQRLDLYFDPERDIDSPPYFMSFIPKIITAPGEIITFSIPQIRDNQFDNFTLIIDYGASFLFVRFKDDLMRIEPDDKHSGCYQGYDGNKTFLPRFYLSLKISSKIDINIIMSQDQDILSVKFKDMALFYERHTNRFTPNYVMYKGVPTQISEDLAQFLSQYGYGFKLTSNTVLGTNLIATLLITYGVLQTHFNYFLIFQ
ncbi:UNKNOWN [Stylonychia lemnae]|uniref:Uncharacterized protein n=1 Tax=Stylonychia lemnae TaxID=5949 RepID=A0A078B329_STYLE|nr:UNKNOWN [Stylonychia lemnae]|eukprot:CDW88915.1 UNKNOWN [Stylonychia lemnae]